MNTKGEQVVCPLQPSLEAERQMHDSQRLKARGRCKLSPRVETSAKLSAGCQLLTTFPWDPGWFIFARSVTAWDKHPWGDTWLTWDCTQEHLWAWAAWTWDLHTALNYGNFQCGPSTASAPHTSQQYLFSVSLPLHSTAEQVSRSKWSLSPPHVRVEIRHWKDLQTEEANLRKEGGNCQRSGRCNRLNPVVKQRLCIWGATVYF